VLVAPAYLLVDRYLSMNSIEPLLWMGCALVLIRIIQSGNLERRVRRSWTLHVVARARRGDQTSCEAS
jgi:hypothetical protein